MLFHSAHFSGFTGIFGNIVRQYKGPSINYVVSRGEGAQCVELELRWRFCVHSSTCPEIYL